MTWQFFTIWAFFGLGALIIFCFGTRKASPTIFGGGSRVQAGDQPSHDTSHCKDTIATNATSDNNGDVAEIDAGKVVLTSLNDAGASKHAPRSIPVGAVVAGGTPDATGIAHTVQVINPAVATNFGNKPMEGRVATELQDRIENHKL